MIRSIINYIRWIREREREREREKEKNSIATNLSGKPSAILLVLRQMSRGFNKTCSFIRKSFHGIMVKVYIHGHSCSGPIYIQHSTSYCLRPLSRHRFRLILRPSVTRPITCSALALLALSMICVKSSKKHGWKKKIYISYFVVIKESFFQLLSFIVIYINLI